MRLRAPASVLLLSAVFAAPALALPPGGEARGFREGANHHLGDDSFVTRFGREPSPSDDEHLRMRTHLVHVRALLASRPATRPELAARRAELLGYLAEYTDKGITPENLHLPWRNPVFIDDAGNVCAVGYLIERTSGLPMAQEIAREHRHDLLEDIAHAMPEVRAWIDASGFTTEELASIQPGYMAPIVETYKPWDLASSPLPDGAFESTDKSTHGAIVKGAMDGKWTRTDADGKIAGSGDMSRGRGTWKSVYPGGARMAEGPYANNRPEGAWTFYHPSGNVAAEGRFENGLRAGEWTFFHDTKERIPIAAGAFDRASVTGTWRHYDSAGKLLAISGDATPARWGGSRAYLLDVIPGAGGVHHWVHQGNIAGDHHRIDAFYDGTEHLYTRFGTDDVYDADGHKLAKGSSGAWTSSDCKWTRTRKAAAHAGDIVTLHGLVHAERFSGGEKCGPPEDVAPARAKRIDAMLLPMTAVRSQSPEFVRKIVLGEATVDGAGETTAADAEATRAAADLAKVLAANMTWYVEWPHVDGRFIRVFHTLPGYAAAGP